MPFQSEKQRKYLWANEPEIARDWTDKYGSRVKKQEGGNLWKGAGSLLFGNDVNNLASKYVLPSAHFSTGDYDRIYNTATNTPDYHADATENLFDHLYTNYENIPYVGGAAAMGIEKLAPYLALGASPFYDFAQAKSEYAKNPAKHQGSKWDKINAYFPDLANTNVSGILNAFDQQDPWSAMWNRARGAGRGVLNRQTDRQNQIQDLLKKGWGAIKNEFGGSAEAAGMPINNNQSILPKARPRMTANYHGGAQFKRNPMDDWGKDIDRFGRSIDESIPQSKWGIPQRLTSGALNWGLDKLVGIPFVGSAINAVRNYEPNQMDVMNRSIVNQLGGYNPQTGRDQYGTNVVSWKGNYQQNQEDTSNFYNTPRGRELMKKWDFHRKKANYANTYLKKNPIYQDWKKGLGTNQGTLGNIGQQVRKNIQTYKITGRGGQGGNRPNTGMNTPGGGKGQSPTGGDVEGTPFARGGLASLWQR